jgi:ABC-type uncharacterized transport system permease subunit
MSIAFLSVITALLYLAAAGLQAAHSLQRKDGPVRSVLTVGLLAMICHAALTWYSLNAPGGVSFGFFKVFYLLFLGINTGCVLALFWRPLQSLLIVLFPLSAVAVVVGSLGPDTGTAHTYPLGIVAHIASSIVAWSLLTMAAVQAALLALQDRQLRKRRMGGLPAVLPPLQLMETMLFELIWLGVIALTLSIGTGVAFIDDIMSQHLVHKTVLSVAAWLLFSILLWGHHRLGWRSQLAIRMTVTGFTLLMLAFLGSKLVLELILQRG